MDGHAPDQLDLRDLAAILRRRWRLIATIFLLAVIGAIGTVKLLAPTYTASALILIDTSRKNLLDPTLQGSSAASETARVDSEVEILGSDGVLMQTIRSQKLFDDVEFAPQPGWRDRVAVWTGRAQAAPPTGEAALGLVLNRFRKAVSVQRRGLTYVIAVTVGSGDAAKAARLANALAQSYIADQLATKIDNTLAARDIIASQSDEARRTLVLAETEFSRYIFDNLEEIVALTGRSELRDMHQRMTDLTARRLETASHVSALRASVSVANWSTLGATVKSEAALSFERERVRLVGALESTPAGSGGEVALKQGLAGIETLLDAAAQQELAAAQAALDATEAAVAAERQALGATIMTTTLPPHILAQLYGLQQVARNATTKYQALLSRAQDLETESSLQVADSRVVSAALAPARPSFPNAALIVALAGIGGLGLGVTAAFVAENLAGGFTSVAQAQAVLRRRLCVALPVQRKPYGSPSVADTVLAAQSSPYGEGVRRLRAIVDIAGRNAADAGELQDAKGRVVLVASSVAGEGKTTVALALARAYAMAGKRVLIVDGDLRQPGVYRQLGIEAPRGIAGLLSGWPSDTDFHHHGICDPRTPVLVVGGGDVAADQLVPEGALERLLVAARQHFDHIILDCPPIDTEVDGLYLASHADTVVFVVRWAKTAQNTAVASSERLAAVMRPGTELLVVLNQAARGSG